MNEKQICPKCGKEMPANADLCPSCGTRVKEKKAVAFPPPEEKKSSRKITALMSLAIAIMGIIVIFAYRAWLGGLIYLVAGGISLLALKGDFEANDSASLPSYVMSCIKEKDLWNKIIAIIVAIIPVVVIFATYRWISVDTAREVDEIMGN